MIKDEPALLTGIVHTDRLVVFGGGIPLIYNGVIVGGIGVSGGHPMKMYNVPRQVLKYFPQYAQLNL